MSDTKPTYAPIVGFPTIDGCLHAGGRSLADLADEFGTPFYVYDGSLIEQRIARLRRVLPDGVGLRYAIKANPLPQLVHRLAGLVDGFDVASVGEMNLALGTGVPAGGIGFAGPGKTDDELAAAAAARVTINLESRGEADRLAAIAARLDVRPRVALRLNPEFEVRRAGLRMTGRAMPFGVDVEQAPDVLTHIGSLDLDLVGFHAFVGTQILDVDAVREAMSETVKSVIRLSQSIGMEPAELAIGGGFGIPYYPGEVHLDLEAVGDDLAALMPCLRRNLPQTRVVLELGRYVVGESGLYVCRVVDRKTSREVTFLVTDGGLHHHLAASGNFGQAVRRNHPIGLASPANFEDRETVTVVGRLCTPLDVIGDRVDLPRAGPGDLLVVFQSGAYGASASPQGFLSHPPPAEILL